MTDDRSTSRRARIVGRVLRFALGLVLIGLAYEVVRSEDLRFNARVAGVIVLLAGLYSAIHFAVNRYVSHLNAWLGATLSLVPAALVYALGGTVGRIGTVVYIGVSLVLQGVRGDGGCEVMAIPALLLGKRTHLVCLVFSPVDWAEEHLAARMANWKRV